MLPASYPIHRTGRTYFRHPALGRSFMKSPTGNCSSAWMLHAPVAVFSAPLERRHENFRIQISFKANSPPFEWGWGIFATSEINDPRGWLRFLREPTNHGLCSCSRSRTTILMRIQGCTQHSQWVTPSGSARVPAKGPGSVVPASTN